MTLLKRLLGKKLSLPSLGSPPLDQVKNFMFPAFWGAQDPEAVAERLKDVCQHFAGGIHLADNLLTWTRNNSMLDDATFVAAWESNAENNSDRAIIWRRYVLACAGYHCLHLDGDFVECGAYTGVGVKTVVDYLGGTAFPRTFWAYDLFHHDPSMQHHKMDDHGPELFERVRQKFKAYPQVQVIRGEIPSVFAGQSPTAIAYLHVDLNEAPAEIAALDALFDRVVPGGVIVLDDYEWSWYRKQKLAEDGWFEARQYRVIPLPTGQGIVLKR